MNNDREALEFICDLCKRLNPQHTGNPDTCSCDETAFLRKTPILDESTKLKSLISKIEQIVPYVTATLSSTSKNFIVSNDVWGQVHKARAWSSRNQLENLLNIAKGMK